MSDALDLLKSIDATLKQLLVLSKVAKPKDIAPDSDLDGKYGDPIVKATDPRDWAGPPMKGRHFSECSSEYLELLASRFDYFAERAERENTLASNGKPAAPYNRRDAARARGWAKRAREGRVPVHAAPVAVTSSEWEGDTGSMADGNPWANDSRDDDIAF